MEKLNRPNRPPDTTALSGDIVTLSDIKEWELGVRSLTPGQIASARHLQNMTIEQAPVVQEPDKLPTIGSLALDDVTLEEITVNQPELIQA